MNGFYALVYKPAKMFFIKKKKRVVKEEPKKPELKIYNSVVPTEYLNTFKSWDSHLYNNNVTVIR